MNMPPASPYSTGGGGTVLEHRYGAILLTHVLASAPLYELGDTAIPLSVKFQAGATSAADDFLVEGVLGDESVVSASVAVRRNPLIQRKNEDSQKLISSFLLTLDQHFDAVVSRNWSIVLVSTVSSTHAQEVSELASIARDASTENLGFRMTVAAANRTTREVRGRLQQLDFIVQDALTRLNLQNIEMNAADLTWLLLSCLRVRLVHLEGGDLSDRTHALERLIPLTSSATAQEAEKTYTRLVELCGSFAPSATEATETHIREHLGPLLADDIWVEGARRKVAREPRIQRHRQLLVPSLDLIRRQSRTSLGLSPEEVARSYCSEPELPVQLRELAPGSLVALTGPIGSGKSDLAARWLLEQVKMRVASHGTPVPFWIRASDLRGSLEAHIEEVLDVPDAPDRFGVDVVLDGLDEIPDAPAVLDMQTFLAKYPKSRLVLTARPGQSLGLIPTYEVPDWSTDEAQSLIQTVTGKALDDRFWSEELKRSVRRPLFALLAAHHSRTDVRNSPAALLVASVNTALGRMSGNSQLEELAIALTRVGRPIDVRQLPNIDLVSLRSSGLVEFAGMRIRFSLPIFEQWFAAQAVLSGRVPETDFMPDLQGFARWRYVLAIAVSSGTHETISPLMGNLARWNPGAAAWVLREGKDSDLDPNPLPLLSDLQTLGEEVRCSVDAWLCGLGSAALALYPMALTPNSASPTLNDLQLMISWDGSRGWIGWWPRTNLEDPLVILHSDLSKAWDTKPHIIHSIQLPVHESWVWDYTHRLLTDSDRLADLLQSQGLLGSLSKTASVISREDFAWRASIALGKSEFYPFRLTGELLKAAADRARAEASESEKEYVVREKRIVPLAFYDELTEKVGQQSDEVLNDVWPGPDLALDEGTRGYSNVRIVERAQAVYEAAAVAYGEIRESLFPKFTRILGHAATFPAVMEGEVHHENDAFGGEYGLTSLNYWLRPVGGSESREVPLVFNLDLADGPTRSWDDLSEIWAALDARRKTDPLGSVFEIASYRGEVLDLAFLVGAPQLMWQSNGC